MLDIYFFLQFQDKKGNYIMFPVAVSGKFENNFVFSTCSKLSVRKIIESRADWCFKRPSEIMSKCGNFNVSLQTQDYSRDIEKIQIVALMFMHLII